MHAELAGIIFMRTLLIIINVSTFVVWLGLPDTASTWEQASNIPATLIQDFEKGIAHTVEVHSFTSGGETLLTLSTKTGF